MENKRPCNLFIRNDFGSLRAFAMLQRGRMVFEYDVLDGVNASKVASMLEAALGDKAVREKIGSGYRIFRTSFANPAELAEFIRSKGFHCK